MKPVPCLDKEAVGPSHPTAWTLKDKQNSVMQPRFRHAALDGREHRCGEAPDVESNLALAAHIASRYRSRRMPREDLFHEGVIGLIRAARRFDPRRGKPFASYAGFWIRKYIREALSRELCFLHVPSHRRFGIGRIAPPRCAAAGELQTVATPRRLAEMSRGCTYDTRGDYFTLSPEDCLLRRERMEIVKQAVDGLSSIERSVIVHRFGLDNDRPQTLARIGSVQGLTRQRVYQIEETAKRRLRRRFKMLGWAS